MHWGFRESPLVEGEVAAMNTWVHSQLKDNRNRSCCRHTGKMDRHPQKFKQLFSGGRCSIREPLCVNTLLFPIFLFAYLFGGRQCFCFKDFFFLMWTILKVFIKFVTVLLLFYALVFGCQECEILVPWPGIELKPSSLEGKVSSIGPPGKSLLTYFWTSLSWHCRLLKAQVVLPAPGDPEMARTCDWVQSSHIWGVFKAGGWPEGSFQSRGG